MERENAALIGARLASILLAAALVGAYAWRAAWGIPAGLAFRSGYAASLRGNFEEALASLAMGERGANRIEAAWLQGEVRLGQWDALPDEARPGRAGADLLARAAGDYLRSAEAVTASFPAAGLAAVYERREREARTRRAVDLGALEAGPWSRVGRDGRIAIGLLRRAIEHEPHNVAIHDQLVSTLLEQGLVDDAHEAIASAARVLPVFDEHRGLRFDAMPRSMQEQFERAARDAMGSAPMLSRSKHRLALGRLAHRLGRADEAVRDLQAAEREPGDDLQRAEIAYHLGLALIDAGRYRDAEDAFDRAARVDRFRVAAAMRRSWLAEREGRTDDALNWVQKALAAGPRDLEVLLTCGRLARQTGRTRLAEDSYRRAAIVAPDDRRALAGLVETAVDAGDASAARRALDQMRRALPDAEEIERLEAAVDSMPRSGGGG